MPFVRIDLVRGRDKAVLMRLVEEVSQVVATPSTPPSTGCGCWSARSTPTCGASAACPTRWPGARSSPANSGADHGS